MEKFLKGKSGNQNFPQKLLNELNKFLGWSFMASFFNELTWMKLFLHSQLVSSLSLSSSHSLPLSFSFTSTRIVSLSCLQTRKFSKGYCWQQSNFHQSTPSFWFTLASKIVYKTVSSALIFQLFDEFFKEIYSLVTEVIALSTL